MFTFHSYCTNYTHIYHVKYYANEEYHVKYYANEEHHANKEYPTILQSVEQFITLCQKNETLQQ